MKTYSAKPTDIVRKWYVVDASELPLGRTATQIANLLTGKGKPQFTKHIDCGDFVIVINAAQTVITGDKSQQKTYYRHSSFPGNLKETSLSDKMDLDPAFAISNAVRGMLPINKLRDSRMSRLKVYSDANHAHEAQKPEIISLKKGK